MDEIKQRWPEVLPGVMALRCCTPCSSPSHLTWCWGDQRQLAGAQPQRFAKAQPGLDGGARLVEQVRLLHKTTSPLHLFLSPPSAFPAGPRRRRRCRWEGCICPSQEIHPLGGGDSHSGEGHGPSKAFPHPTGGLKPLNGGDFHCWFPQFSKGFRRWMRKKVADKKDPKAHQLLVRDSKVYSYGGIMDQVAHRGKATSVSNIKGRKASSRFPTCPSLSH